MSAITGERASTAYRGDPHRALIWQMHVKTYEYASTFARGAKVLDFGCGTGFGCNIVSEVADSVVGVDISSEAVRDASSTYGTSRVRFHLINDVAREPLPFEDESFNVVVSSHVIEHLRSPEPYLRETWRVLSPGGAVVIATPNRLGRLRRWQRPFNRFHYHEYDAQELTSLLQTHFETVQTIGLTGRDEYVDAELRRARKLSRALFPVTNVLVPDICRRYLLAAISWMHSRTSTGLAFGDSNTVNLGPDDFHWTSDTSERSPYLVAACRK